MKVPASGIEGLMSNCYSRKALVFVFLAGIAFGAPRSQAQTFNEAPNQTFYLDLDTNDRGFSKWSHRDLGSFSGLRATIEFYRLGKGQRWVDRWQHYIWLCESLDGAGSSV
jgi:hypothetical protein